MESYGIKDVENLFLSLCRICRENQESFTEADSRLGDGDMGITIGKGAAAVERILHDREAKELKQKRCQSCLWIVPWNGTDAPRPPWEP